MIILTCPSTETYSHVKRTKDEENKMNRESRNLDKNKRGQLQWIYCDTKERDKLGSKKYEDLRIQVVPIPESHTEYGIKFGKSRKCYAKSVYVSTPP